MALLLRPSVSGRAASAALAVVLIPSALAVADAATYIWSVAISAFVVGGTFGTVAASLRGDCEAVYRRGVIVTAVLLGGISIAIGATLRLIGFEPVLIGAVVSAALLLWLGVNRPIGRTWPISVWLTFIFGALLWVGATNPAAQRLVPETTHASRPPATISIAKTRA